MQGYNLEYHKQLNRSHILPNILEGAKAGILSQFVSDIVLSLLLYNEALIIEDIEISEIPAYYASVASGMMVGFLSIYMDPFAVALFSTATYAYVFAFMDTLINGVEFNPKPVELIFDTGVSILLIFAFDATAHNQYLRYQEKRHFIEPTHPRMDRNIGQNIFIIVLVSTYGFLKVQDELNTEEGEETNQEATCTPCL